ncbi:threonine-phosphate decarboxylase, partial [Salmonella enterica subsp. enterica serovar Typhimurium]|uniref:aminotransferase class I/II-fold pyridoxal phosphate-dependent enzyme n=1 Tax=Salmonella enterica TaxID=28901 RepID=UPI000C029B26
LQAREERGKERKRKRRRDEARMEFRKKEKGVIPALKEKPPRGVLRSLTKFYAIPGLRLGYLVNSDDAAMARRRSQQMPWSVNALAALAGEVA